MNCYNSGWNYGILCVCQRHFLLLWILYIMVRSTLERREGPHLEWAQSFLFYWLLNFHLLIRACVCGGVPACISVYFGHSVTTETEEDIWHPWVIVTGGCLQPFVSTGPRQKQWIHLTVDLSLSSQDWLSALAQQSSLFQAAAPADLTELTV